MSDLNDTQKKIYDQLMAVNKCINALKDVSHNVPEEDTYMSVISIVTERLELEFNTLLNSSFELISEFKNSLP
jgi:hypothetical protein